MADNQYKLKFTLSNGSTIEAGTITCPQGPTGATGPQGPKGDSGATPTITVASGSNIGTTGTPSVTATTSGTTTTLTFNYLKGAKGDKGDTGATGAAGATGPQGVSVTGATLVAVQGGYMADNKYKLKLTLSNGTTIEAGTITCPQGPAGTTTWAGITDKPSTFTPATHTHSEYQKTIIISDTAPTSPTLNQFWLDTSEQEE